MVNYFHPLLLKLEKSYVMNVGGVFLIQFIVCNWILLTKENVMSNPKIRVVKLVGATNWATWKRQMNMNFEKYNMLSIT